MLRGLLLVAAGVVASSAAARVAKVYDQHDQFLSLEGGLFSLGLPDTYLQARSGCEPLCALCWGCLPHPLLLL